MVKQNGNPNGAQHASRLHELLGNEVTVIRGRKAKSAPLLFFLKYTNISKWNEEYKREVSLPVAYTPTEANICGFICSTLWNYYSLISFWVRLANFYKGSENYLVASLPVEFSNGSHHDNSNWKGRVFHLLSCRCLYKIRAWKAVKSFMVVLQKEPPCICIVHTLPKTSSCFTAITKRTYIPAVSVLTLLWSRLGKEDDTHLVSEQVRHPCG